MGLGRPKLELDNDLIIQLREHGGLGWRPLARRYEQITGTWLSRETAKRRYYEYRENKRGIER